MKDALNETFPSLWVLYCEVIDLVGSHMAANQISRFALCHPFRNDCAKIHLLEISSTMKYLYFHDAVPENRYEG
jgi:hypothetical protein